MDINDVVNKLVADIDEIPAYAEVTYEVWAIGHDEEDKVADAGAEMLLGTFEDPDLAVNYAKAITLADVVHMSAVDEYEAENPVHYISIEVETVVLDDEEGTMNIGTVYRKVIEVFKEEPECVFLSDSDFELLEDNNIMVSCELLSGHSKNDSFVAVFKDDNHSFPMAYKIISKTTSGRYICEFV